MISKPTKTKNYREELKIASLPFALVQLQIALAPARRCPQKTKRKRKINPVAL